jgi:integrase
VATVRLTKTLVENTPPSAKDAVFWDATLKGFGLKVTPKGVRTYILQYRPRGLPTVDTKLRRFTIGHHGSPWTTETARAAAIDLLAKVRLGEDPAANLTAQRVRERREAAEADAAAVAEVTRQQEEARLAFEVVAEEFLEKHASRNRTAKETRRILQNDAVPAWKGWPITAITKRDVIELIDDVEERSIGAARLLFAHLRKLFNWCVERGYLDLSPCISINGPALFKARTRWLSDDEIRLVWLACDELGPPYGPLFQLLLLTAQRRSEVSGLEASELNLDRAEWIIPADRTKNGREHAVDLSPLAVEILKPRVPAGSNQRFLFTTTGTTPVSGHSAARKALDAIIAAKRVEEAQAKGLAAPSRPMIAWRLHDLRRTAATHMSRLGARREVVEAVLNHTSGVRGGLVAVYQHYDHRDERKAALLAWADHIRPVVKVTETEEKSAA